MRGLVFSSPSWTRSTFVNDQAIKWAKAKACVFADSVLCIGRMEQGPGASKRKIERPSWRSQDVFIKSRCCGTRRRSNRIRVDKFPRIFDIGYSSGDPERLGGEVHPTRELRGPDHLHVCVQWHSVEIRWSELHLERWERQGLRKEILTRTLDFSGFRVGKESLRWLSRWTVGPYSQHSGRQQFKETGHPIFISTSASSRGILKQRRGECTIQFNGDSVNTVHCVNQISVYAAVTNWCYQFALTKEEKEQVAIPVVEFWSWWNPKKWKCLYVLRNWHRETWCRVVQASEYSKKIQMTQLCEKALFQHLVTAGNRYQIGPGGDDGWREITLLCRKYLVSRIYLEAKALAAIPAGTIIGPVSEVHIVKILDEYGLEVAIPSLCRQGFLLHTENHSQEWEKVDNY